MTAGIWLDLKSPVLTGRLVDGKGQRGRDKIWHGISFGTMLAVELPAIGWLAYNLVGRWMIFMDKSVIRTQSLTPQLRRTLQVSDLSKHLRERSMKSENS